MTTQNASLQVEPVKKAYEQVAEQLRDLIVSGELRIGDKLPSEAELCERFTTSRSTIREALRLLVSQSLITTKRGARGGSVISQPAPEDISRFLTTTLTLLAGSSEMSVRELCEARALLEVPAVRMVARLDDRGEIIGGLDSLKQANYQAAPRQQTFSTNKSFHEQILLASGNRALYLMASPIFRALEQRFLVDARKPEFWETINAEHAEIAEALRSGDHEAAGSAMQSHLDHLRYVYESLESA